ncbi:MAG: hypothetical protein KGJ13_08535 [Patescibacteria group bacterium]|nr:hypothetical protein [Patescibacteria group bacterium]
MAVSAPLATPTPNVGAQAQGVLLAAQALQIMQKALGIVSPTTPLGQALAHALKTIGKQVGSPPESQLVNSLQSQLIEAQRSAMQRAAIAHNLTGGGVAAPGAAPVSPPSAAPGPTMPMAA